MPFYIHFKIYYEDFIMFISSKFCTILYVMKLSSRHGCVVQLYHVVSGIVSWCRLRVLCSVLSCHIVLCCVVFYSCRVVSCSCHVVSRRACRVVLCRVMSCRECRVVLCCVMSCRVVYCRALFCRVVSCCVVSCHVMFCMLYVFVLCFTGPFPLYILRCFFTWLTYSFLP